MSALTFIGITHKLNTLCWILIQSFSQFTFLNMNQFKIWGSLSGDYVFRVHWKQAPDSSEMLILSTRHKKEQSSVVGSAIGGRWSSHGHVAPSVGFSSSPTGSSSERALWEDNFSLLQRFVWHVRVVPAALKVWHSAGSSVCAIDPVFPNHSHNGHTAAMLWDPETLNTTNDTFIWSAMGSSVLDTWVQMQLTCAYGWKKYYTDHKQRIIFARFCSTCYVLQEQRKRNSTVCSASVKPYS
jgi:hypothetical protein